MKEALSAILEFSLKKSNLNRIEAQVYVENHRSVKLLQKLGFAKEGRLRENFLISGKFEDAYIFSLIKNDYKTSN